MQERMEGLQGWMAEIERKQGRMTYFGGAAALVAIAASAGALYLGVTTKDDSATKDDVDEINTQLEATQTEVKRTVEKALKATNDRIATLEQQVADLEQKQSQNSKDIATLQSQGNAGQAGGGAGLNANKP
jgi:septal ring factor EnvC (AmiA/AmiB activator)